jgi:septal ring factor EnvC (AmiA/AmiB activator)
MSSSQEHPLIEASRRLMGAIDRLERNLQQMSVAKDRDAQQEKRVIQFSRENESLKSERENLNKAISTLTGQYKDLQQTATTIHSKLDDSIKRITQIIEG